MFAQLNQGQLEVFREEVKGLCYPDGSKLVDGNDLISWCSEQYNVEKESLIVRITTLDEQYAVTRDDIYDVVKIQDVSIHLMCAKCGRAKYRMIKLCNDKEIAWCQLCAKWEEVAEHMCLTALDDLSDTDMDSIISSMQEVIAKLDKAWEEKRRL